ncbi:MULTISPECIES: hypothetical protein [unclassified Pedobacter]|uniref:hypothetical protein n=1 Tax=unclassified Pedobacter TaxID=2628915 RepID=UPI0014236927|nr:MULTISPECIES: hypothetical protein [unclassified Pedobacter]NII83880.1 RNase P subunit RPR2 [Pedobacter sp. SG908]NMN37754.1 RNase P subunit RPR2 [Pedobacter sp. SG918]
MTIDELTLEVLADKALSQFDSKKLVSWAVSVLELGYENENLFILAGLDFDSTEEREHYFWKSIADLKLSVEKTEEQLLEKYGQAIANRAIEKKISIEYAFQQMNRIVSASGYDSKYLAFYEINEDLEYLKYENKTIYHSGLTTENANEFIFEEFRIFALMEDLKIPQEFRNQCYCQRCKKLNIPVTRNKFQLKRPFRYAVSTCGICGSEKLKHSNDHEVKWIIINEYKKSRLSA